jgi:flavodoxin
VIDVLTTFLREHAGDIVVTQQIAETAQPDDLKKGDHLLLACGTWNTGGVEGQLNPHMDLLLRKRAKDVDLGGKTCALVALGDDRYYYTCRAVEHLQQYVKTHNGQQTLTPLLVVNDPYGQEERVRKWVEKLIPSIRGQA